MATARAAAAAGVPFTLSTTSSRSIEEVAAAAPDGTRWFQLYVQSDPTVTRSLVERAAAAGYRAHRADRRPAAARLPRPRSTVGLRAAVRSATSRRPLPRTATMLPRRPTDLSHLSETSLTWRDLATIRSWSDLPLVVKGILTAEDARLAVEHGVDAIVVSNHGARQLDRVSASVDVLGEVVGRGRRPRRALGRWRRPSRARHRDRARARGARRPCRPADVLGARGGRAGRRRAGARDPARRVRDRPDPAGNAHPGGHPRRAPGAVAALRTGAARRRCAGPARSVPSLR